MYNESDQSNRIETSVTERDSVKAKYPNSAKPVCEYRKKKYKKYRTI